MRLAPKIDLVFRKCPSRKVLRPELGAESVIVSVWLLIYQAALPLPTFLIVAEYSVLIQLQQ